MFLTHIKLAWRLLQRQKGFAFINIAGLAAGLTCFLLIGLYLRFELSYDTFHAEADRIYRVVKSNTGLNFRGTTEWAVTPGPLPAALMAEAPTVATATQFAKARSLVEHGKARFYEEGLFVAPHFFEVFDFEVLFGDPATMLNAPNALVLTASLAQKYFGDIDPLNQLVTLTHTGEHHNGAQTMQVTGVVADVPANSHFTFDFLVPASTSHELAAYLTAWDSNSYLTYVRLHPEVTEADFTAQLVALSKAYLHEDTPTANAGTAQAAFAPQALTDIHLHSQLNGEFGPNGNIRYVYLFGVIAVLILLIACVNYINLAVARALTRTREAGVRKALGAQRSQLVAQFMSEAVVPSVGALVLALALVSLLLPSFSNLTGKPLALLGAAPDAFTLVLLLVGLGVGVLAGSYPAWALSAYHPVRLLKPSGPRGLGGTRLRNGLVLAQFTITTVLVAGALVTQRQMHFLQHAPTGLDRDLVLAIDIEDKALHTQFDALRHTLNQHPGVLGVSAATNEPTRIAAASRARDWEGAPDGAELLVYRSRIQPGYLDLFGLELVEGRAFDASLASDATEGVLINETLRQQLGWETAIGKRFPFYGRDLRVTGVVQDFHFDSFHHAIQPLALMPGTGWFTHQRVFVKLQPTDVAGTVAFVEDTFAQFSPAFPFTYRFLDDSYNAMYQAEHRVGTLVSAFTILALLIAAMGLVGLAAFATARRTKEVGVRKVMGASVPSLLLLLARHFLGLVALAFVLGTPLAWLAANRWLDGFAYRIDLGPSIFLATGGFLLFVALLAVSWQALRAALSNPVDALRYE